jgi:tetratricopeptide (TPR) repeat protein
MAISEIEKLERRYAENPQGLTFAPLAEVHRKNGDVGRALDLLRPGLQLHPDYIPASIVLGRCHFDLGDLPAAETAFNHVLELDGENVIALKALADISERLSRFDEAEQWLRTLLAIDRSNDEARNQLERIEAAKKQVELGSSANPDAPRSIEITEATPAPASTAPAEGERLAEVETSEPIISWVSKASPTDTLEETPAPLQELMQDSISSTIEPMQGTEELDPQHPFVEPVQPLPGLVGRDQQDLELGEEFKVETSEDIVLQSSGGGEFQVPNASEELAAGGPAPRPPFEEDAPLRPVGFEPRGTGREETAAEEKAEERAENRAEERAESRAEVRAPEERVEARTMEEGEPEPDQPAVAETQAEQSVSQREPEWLASEEAAGQPELASSEFAPPAPEPTPQEPVSEPSTIAASEETAPWQFSTAAPSNPPEPMTVPEPELVVTETMAEVLRDQGHPADALRVYRELESRSAGNPRLREKIAELEEAARALMSAPRHSYLARETQGQSVAEFFRDLLAARPPAAGPAQSAPAPSSAQPAPEATGAPTRPATETLSLSAVFGEEGTPTPPAVPGPAAPAGSGVSYDEFFGGQAAASSQRGGRTSDSKSDDLDQFHAWLQNLKR